MTTNNPKILFYEWSDLKSQPLGFINTNDFINFCINSGIKISGNNKHYLNQNDTTYAVCRKGYPELVLSGDMKNLRKNFSRHNLKVLK